MLYISHSILFLVWFFLILRKDKYSWQAILSAYLIYLFAVDVVEIVFSHYLGFYKFPARLFSNFEINNQFGLTLSDGLILPLNGIIFCHYAIRMKNHWFLVFIFTLGQFILELIYLNLGYILYLKWATWLSVIFYTIGFSISAKYASRLIKYEPSPVSYSIIIGTATYGIATWCGAVFSGLFGLYEWHPHLFKSFTGEISFPEITMGELFGCVAAILIPKVPLKYRPVIFLTLPALGTVFYYFGHGKGWLIYRHWNHLLSALRWFVPFSIIIWFDRWQSTYLSGRTNLESK
jgi:hypothetical protein